MKKIKKKKAEKVPDRREEFPGRLVELEAELRSYPTRPADDVSLSSIQNPKVALFEKEPVVQFSFNGKVYAAGHTDLTFADSNHARGVRHISFHADGKVVLYIEGNFEDQQFGSNFQFHNLEIYTPGEWEKDFLALSDELQNHNAKRREAFRKKRASDKSGHGRDLSRR
jgi:hypothetical protein